MSETSNEDPAQFLTDLQEVQATEPSEPEPKPKWRIDVINTDSRAVGVLCAGCHKSLPAHTKVMRSTERVNGKFVRFHYPDCWHAVQRSVAAYRAAKL